MSQKQTVQNAVDLAAERVASARRVFGDEVPLPSDEEVESIIRATYTDRGGRVRMLRNPRKDAGDEARGFMALLRWHAGVRGFNLDTPVFWNMVLGADRYQRIENLCLVLLRDSAAVRRWRQALGVA